jgi:hypothetical protein
MSKENPSLPDYEDLPEVDQTDTDLPESIATVESEKEAIKTFDDLWMNLRYQHREKFKKYADMQSSLSSMSFDRQETRIDFTELNELRDEIVKLEGGMETMNIQRRLLRNEDPEPWVESEIKKAKIKVKTNSPNSKKRGTDAYKEYTDWQGTDNPDMNKTV